MAVDTLILQLLDLASQFLEYSYNFATTLIWWYVTPLADIVAYYDPTNVSAIITGPVFYLIKDFSLLQLTLGAGIGIYLVYQFLTWLLNLVT